MPEADRLQRSILPCLSTRNFASAYMQTPAHVAPPRPRNACSSCPDLVSTLSRLSDLEFSTYVRRR